MNQITKLLKVFADKYNSVSLILRIALGLVLGAVLALVCPGVPLPEGVRRYRLLHPLFRCQYPREYGLVREAGAG